MTFTVADRDTPAAADEKVDQKPAANVSGPAVATDDDTVRSAVALAGALLGAALAGAGTVLVMRRRTPGAGA